MVQQRYTLLAKHGLFAVVSLYLNEHGGMVASLDVRCTPPLYREQHPDILEAIDAYTRAIQTSIKRGWLIVYTGQPNFG